LYPEEVPATCLSLARPGTPAPQCVTGDLARQIAENGLEIGQIKLVRQFANR